MNLNLSDRDYYRLSGSCYAKPWERQFLNLDFYEYEKNRINKTEKWLKSFEVSGVGDILDSVELYCIPLKITKTYDYYSTLSKDFPGLKLIALSALNNSIQNPIYALVDEREFPDDYSLIRINKSYKIRVMGKKSLQPLDLLNIVEHVPLSPDKILVDVPIENNFSFKLIKENLISDETIATALLLPLMSSPLVVGELGGIGLTSFADRAGLNDKIIKELLLSIPPVYSSIMPTKSTVKGSWISMDSGLSIRPAENVANPIHYVDGVSNYSDFNPARLKRLNHNGEFSILSNFNSDFNSANKELFHSISSFGLTEVFLPDDLSRKIDDGALKKFSKSINEDTWIQIAHSRQLTPTTFNFDNKYQAELDKTKKDIDVLTADISNRDLILEPLIDQATSNIFKNAKALSRSEGKDLFDEIHIKKSRNLFLDTFNNFWQSDVLRPSKVKFEQSKNTLARAIIIALQNQPYLTDLEIWERVKNGEIEFKKFLGTIDFLHRERQIFKNSEGKYAEC